MNRTDIWTDGACLGNPGRGGWAALIIEDGAAERLLSGAERETTNNRMELTAVLEGLRAVEGPARICLDSAYVEKAFTENWVARWERRDFYGIKNPDLWRELIPEVRRRSVTWRRIKGHSGIALNERVDQTATAAARSLSRSGQAPVVRRPPGTLADIRARRSQLTLL